MCYPACQLESSKESDRTGMNRCISLRELLHFPRHWIIPFLFFLNSQIIIFLHFVFMAVILTSTEAKKLRLSVTAKKLANVYENYKKQILSVDRSPKRNSRHIAFLNLTPSYKRRVYMFSKTGFLLQIDKSGRISGTLNTSSENGELACLGPSVCTHSPDILVLLPLPSPPSRHSYIHDAIN